MMKSVHCFLLGPALWAASPTAWEMTSYQDFLKGRFTGVSLSRDGRVMLAPRLETVLATDQPAVLALASAPDGSIYLGTGHGGQLFGVDRAGKGRLLWTAPEPEIFALAVDAAGRVYAATSPNGKIYRIEGGKSTEFFDPSSRYIWAMAIASDGALYAGTGGEGRIFRIPAAGKGEVWYETGQSHVTSLALDAQGALLAGSEPNGIIYRVTAKDKAFVLHDANLPEIRALAAAPDGSIYAAAMGGSVQRQTTFQPGATPSVTSTVTPAATSATITVTDTSAQGGAEVRAPPATAPSAQQSAQAVAAPVVEYLGVEKSAVLKIHADNTVETLWSSKEENVYDLALSGGSVLLATDNQGRVYRLDAGRKTTLLAESGQGEALRLAPGPGGVLVATGDSGKLLRIAPELSPSGEFESPVHDATTVARWGRVSWRAEACPGCQLQFRTRTGNSARPDRTWSEWSVPLREASGAQMSSPNARYVQWKAELSGGASTPVLDSVRLAYLPQNTAPVVKTVTISAQTASAGAKTSTQTAAQAAYSVTVTDTGETGASSLTGTATQFVTRASLEQILISWAAEDADGDKLTYALHFRPQGDIAWTLLKANFTESQHALDAESLADGLYYFRVTASDRGANPSGQARENDLTSPPVLVDRTPPVVTITSTAGGFRIEAIDAASPLKSCEYSVDAGPWTPLAPGDGVLDSLKETFTLGADVLPAGRRLVAVRVYDSANNAGLAKF